MWAIGLGRSWVWQTSVSGSAVGTGGGEDETVQQRKASRAKNESARCCLLEAFDCDLKDRLGRSARMGWHRSTMSKRLTLGMLASILAYSTCAEQPG